MPSKAKPGTCPCCGKKDRSDIIDVDGPHKHYQCDRCLVTWMQHGYTGKPVLSSIAANDPRKVYRSLVNCGVQKNRAIRMAEKEHYPYGVNREPMKRMKKADKLIRVARKRTRGTNR